MIVFSLSNNLVFKIKTMAHFFDYHKSEIERINEKTKDKIDSCIVVYSGHGSRNEITIRNGTNYKKATIYLKHLSFTFFSFFALHKISSNLSKFLGRTPRFTVHHVSGYLFVFNDKNSQRFWEQYIGKFERQTQNIYLRLL